MIVYGKNVAEEIISSNIKIKKAIVSKNFNNNEIMDYLNRNNIKIEILDKNIMDKKYKGNHQGIILDINIKI